MAEPPIQVSKWLDARLLVDPEDMVSLFSLLEPFILVQLGVVLPAGKAFLDKESYLQHYREYIEALRSGAIPKKLIAAALTTDQKDLYTISVPGGREITQNRRPVIQVQEHTLDFSSVDHKFRSMVKGESVMSWGLQFSYPQLFVEPKTGEVEQVLTSPHFPNSALFQKIQRWMRNNTIPTPFMVAGEKVNVPVRLGKTCFSWINNHPQLHQKGLHIAKMA